MQRHAYREFCGVYVSSFFAWTFTTDTFNFHGSYSTLFFYDSFQFYKQAKYVLVSASVLLCIILIQRLTLKEVQQTDH
jgi:hypothetical protein